MFRYVLLALLVTEVSELMTAVIMGIRDFYELRLVFLVNLMTNPLISVLYLAGGIFLGPALRWYLIAAELAVWLTEAAVYQICIEKKRSFLLFSAVANAVSVFAGVLAGRWISKERKHEKDKKSSDLYFGITFNCSTGLWRCHDRTGLSGCDSGLLCNRVCA